MVIFTRTEDLLAWLLPKSERFPKPYRHTLTQRTLDAALDLHAALCHAEATRATARRDALEVADAALNRLRAYLKLIFQWQWLSVGQYQHVSRLVAEVGRLLGGWLRRERQQ